jgi:hypothetical protein
MNFPVVDLAGYGLFWSTRLVTIEDVLAAAVRPVAQDRYGSHGASMTARCAR